LAFLELRHMLGTEKSPAPQWACEEQENLHTVAVSREHWRGAPAEDPDSTGVQMNVSHVWTSEILTVEEIYSE
jgi:hypothetical protein